MNGYYIGCYDGELRDGALEIPEPFRWKGERYLFMIRDTLDGSEYLSVADGADTFSEVSELEILDSVALTCDGGKVKIPRNMAELLGSESVVTVGCGFHVEIHAWDRFNVKVDSLEDELKKLIDEIEF